MAKETVQGIILKKLDNLESKMDQLIPVVEGLKIKAGMLSFVVSAVTTAIITAIVKMWH